LTHRSSNAGRSAGNAEQGLAEGLGDFRTRS
jgi:hypothetical protein